MIACRWSFTRLVAQRESDLKMIQLASWQYLACRVSRDSFGSGVKILVTLAYGDGCVRSEELDKPHFSIRINLVLASKWLP